MPNPFFYGGRITNPQHFVGRAKELRQIFSGLETKDTGHLQHFQVIGPRRIGKSSLLYHLTQTYSQRLSQPEKYRFVYVDLDDARCHTLEGLLRYVLEGLEASHLGHPTLERFQDVIEDFIQKRALYPVLCLDEFEHLTQRKEQFPNEIYEAWRSLGSGSKIGFITASQHPLGKLIQQGNLTSTFHNIFTPVQLGEFSEEEARALLGRNLDRPFTEDEQRRLFKLAKFHPAHLQIAAQLLYNAKENPSLDWGALDADYQERLRNIEPVKPVEAGPAWYARILNALFITSPTALGRFVLEVFKNKDASDRTAAILGWIIMLGAIAILLGWLNIESILALWLSLSQGS